jgi:hypothetical protein
MIKKLALTALATLMLCGPVLAQTNPGYANVTAATNGTSTLVLNANFLVSPPGTVNLSMVSTTGTFTASFWKYDPYVAGASAHGFVPIAFQSTTASSDTLSVKQNVIYPVSIKCDFILLTGVSSAQDVDIYWYQ